MNPASPNLENLRKRAKSLLRLHAERHFPVAERIRSALPAFAERSDREVLEASFTLAQAQQVIAREHGFADWTQLTRSLEDMPVRRTDREPTPSHDAPEIVGVHPQIFVTDLDRAVAFYRDRLGFSVAYLYGDPAYYGLVVRGAAGLNLRHVDALPFDAAMRARESLLAATLIVRNLKALFVQYKEAGLEFHQPYREQPWNAHDFIVADPDGNLIHFASVPGER